MRRRSRGRFRGRVGRTRFSSRRRGGRGRGRSARSGIRIGYRM